MNVRNGSPKPFFIFDQPVTDSPVFARNVFVAVIAQPAFRGVFVSLHKEVAILFRPIKDKMDVVVHQAEADDLDRVVQTEAAKAEGYPVDPGDEFKSGGKEDIILQAFRGVMIVMRLFHNLQFPER